MIDQLADRYVRAEALAQRFGLDHHQTEVGGGFWRYIVPVDTGDEIRVRWFWGRRELGRFCVVPKSDGLPWQDSYVTRVLICRYQPWRVWVVGIADRWWLEWRLVIPALMSLVLFTGLLFSIGQAISAAWT